MGIRNLNRYLKEHCPNYIYKIQVTIMEILNNFLIILYKVIKK